MAPKRQSAKQRKANHAASWRRGLVGAVAALYVARPLAAGDAAAEAGDGLMIVMLWVLLGVAWLAGAAKQGTISFRFGWIDTGVLLLLGWNLLSGLVAIDQGSPRPAINMIWEWTGLVIGYLLVRQLIASAAETRALLGAMMGLAVGLALAGFYQYSVSLPEARQRYEQIKDNPQQMLAEVGQYYPPDSPQRINFENRLRSDEPTASFALANSLAGFLAPWLVMLLGTGLLGWGAQRAAAKWLRVACLAAPLAICLLLTKSRSAVLATMFGLALLWPACRPAGRAGVFKWMLFAVLGLAAVVGAAATAGGLDREVFSEAGKSLGYRLQYWQSSLRLVADHPLLGGGPGQFQTHYTAYKLPEASEEISDPHNFAFELAATAGLPALIIFLAIAAAVGHRSWIEKNAKSTAVAIEATPAAAAPVWVGACLGIAVAFIAGSVSGSLSVESLLIVAVSLPVSMLLLNGWIQSGDLSPRLLATGCAVLLVNLLAAGGIAFPGVAGTFWLLAALAVNLTDRPAAPQSFPMSKSAIALALSGLIVVLCYTTAYPPVMLSRGKQSSAEATPTAQDNQRQQLLLAAVDHDPLAAEPWLLLAKNYLFQYQRYGTRDALDGFLAAAQTATLRAPRSATLWSDVGRLYARLYAQTHLAEHLELAVRAQRRSVELYPHSSQRHAELALVLDQIGDKQGAEHHARRALELDEIAREAGHVDRVLSDEQCKHLVRIAGGPN